MDDNFLTGLHVCCRANAPFGNPQSAIENNKRGVKRCQMLLLRTIERRENVNVRVPWVNTNEMNSGGVLRGTCCVKYGRDCGPRDWIGGPWERWIRRMRAAHLRSAQLPFQLSLAFCENARFSGIYAKSKKNLSTHGGTDRGAKCGRKHRTLNAEHRMPDGHRPSSQIQRSMLVVRC